MIGYFDPRISTLTESPIEERLARTLAEESRFRVVTKDELPDNLRLGWVYVVPQYVVGPYRFDLALLFLDESGALHRWNVECDGKDWHSSPQQIVRDKKRDDFSKSRGWRVMRFRGGKIHHRAEEIANRISDETLAVSQGVRVSDLEEYLSEEAA